MIEQDNQLVGVGGDRQRLCQFPLGSHLQVDTFIMLTDVTVPKLNLDQPDETDLVNLTVADAEDILLRQFGIRHGTQSRSGDRFYSAGGKRAIIASLSQVVAAVRGELVPRYAMREGWAIWRSGKCGADSSTLLKWLSTLVLV